MAILTAAIVACAFIAACGMSPANPVQDSEAESTPTPTANAFAAGSLQDPLEGATAVHTGKPIAVRIPSLGVSTPLESLTIGPSGELGAPIDYNRAGWYVDGPVPGEIGPAVIAGHVDSVTGIAVFSRLAELKAGDEVYVDTESGRSLRFIVTTRMQSAKATFPSADVYRNVPRPELRLITCAGVFDRSVGHYTDNLIVFAALAL
ncbi:class F sortase [Leifsonia sp. YIM 134122]|uniref:Class F sortase n=1 Tax=Leifsonia stereocauli TaxID=3134136 RepID=A0ABU9W0K4_9MICO